MKIQTWQIPQAKVSASGGAPAVSKSPANPAAGKHAPRPFPASHRASENERRRSQRVLLRVRANIHVALQGQQKTFDVATLSVNPHGAVVIMNQSLPADTRLVLEHAGTKQRVPCKVARPPQQMAEGYHVPLEFDDPAPDFWKIGFPPSDWRPDNL